MDWVTAIWAILIGGWTATAVPHLLIGMSQQGLGRKAPTSNVFEKNVVLVDKAFSRTSIFENRSFA
jgi:hypothetical protein